MVPSGATAIDPGDANLAAAPSPSTEPDPPSIPANVVTLTLL